MKFTQLFILLVVLLSGKSLFSQSNDTISISFYTTGNCYMCKERIEDCLDKNPGVVSKFWNYTVDITTVTYDRQQTDPYEIMQMIADTGHETEWYPADSIAYTALGKTCCEYDRVIDYSNVQIGYLSVMGVWVNALAIHEESFSSSIKMLMPERGILSLFVAESILNSNLQLELYSLNGQLIYKQSLNCHREDVQLYDSYPKMMLVRIHNAKGQYWVKKIIRN